MSIITYSRVENNNKDIPKLLEFHKLEEISRFISIDKYNVYSRKLFENKGFVACGADNKLINYTYKTN